MLITRAYRYRLTPRRSQVKKLARFGGATRYAWNWLLAMTERENEAVKAAREGLDDLQRAELERVLKLRGDKRKVAVEAAPAWLRACLYPSMHYARLYKAICQHRDTDARWLSDVHSHCYSNAAKRLSAAYDRWWKRLKQGQHGGHPRFHGRGQESFTIQISQTNIRHRSIRVPMIGWVRVENAFPREEIPEDAKVVQITCRSQADWWEASVTVTQVQIADPPRRIGPVVGIDLGVNAVATIARSDRPEQVIRIDPPRPLARELAHLGELQRRFSCRQDYLRCVECGWQMPLSNEKKASRPRKCECGARLRRWRSNRARRLQVRIARCHAHVANIRADHLHKLSDWLTGPEVGARVIVTEGHDVTDLVSKGVEKTRKGKRKRDRRREMLDLGWGELRRQLGYKSEWRGVDYVETDKGEPTDMECHVCGRENKMPDNTSEYHCGGCRLETTRQENTSWLMVGYGSGGDPTGSPGGDPGQGRGDDTAGGSGACTRDSDSRGSGVNGRTNEDVPRGRKAPGEPRKRKKARKTGDASRQSSRASKRRRA